MALLACVGVDEEGFREALAVEVAGSEKGTAYASLYGVHLSFPSLRRPLLTLARRLRLQTIRAPPAGLVQRASCPASHLAVASVPTRTAVLSLSPLRRKCMTAISRKPDFTIAHRITLLSSSTLVIIAFTPAFSSRSAS